MTWLQDRLFGRRQSKSSWGPVKSVGYLLLAVGIFVTAVANAKCASSSTSERFSEAETIVLVGIESSRDGPVPWPYGLSKGALPGKLLTLRVLKAWKGTLRPGDVAYGWTWSPRSEDAYTRTEVGAKILVFFPKGWPHDILSCNAAPPDRINKTSEELDSISRKDSPNLVQRRRSVGSGGRPAHL